MQSMYIVSKYHPNIALTFCLSSIHQNVLTLVQTTVLNWLNIFEEIRHMKDYLTFCTFV